MVFKLTEQAFFLFTFWRAAMMWWCLTTCFALLLSLGDPYFLDFKNAVYTLFVSGVELIHFTISLVLFFMIKPIIKSSNFPSSLKILAYISILFNLGLIINIYFGVQFDIAKEVFPFTMSIEALAKITPFLGIYYWKYFTFKDKNVVLLNTFLFYVATIPGGNRYQLLFSAFFIIFFLVRLSNVKKLSITIFLVVIYIPLAPIHNAFKAATATPGSLSRIENMIKAFDKVSSETESNIVDKFRKRILHSYYLIAPVYEHLENTDSVGFAPAYSAMQSIIPASYYKDNNKPWPGSVDGSRFSSFSYLINGIAFDQGHNMSEFPRTLHYLWEWNYIYLALMSVISAFYLASLFYLSNLFRDKLYIIPILSIFPLTYNRFFPTIIEILQAISYVILPIVVLFALKSLFIFLKKSVSCNSCY